MEQPLPERIVNVSEALGRFPTLTPRMAHWLGVADPVAELVDATADWKPGSCSRLSERPFGD